MCSLLNWCVLYAISVRLTQLVCRRLLCAYTRTVCFTRLLCALLDYCMLYTISVFLTRLLCVCVLYAINVCFTHPFPGGSPYVKCPQSKSCMFRIERKVYSQNLHVWVRKEGLFSQPACLGSKRKSILTTCMFGFEKKVYSQNLHD